MPKRLTPRGQAAPPVEPIVTGATMPPKPPRKKAAPKAEVEPVDSAHAMYVYNLRAIECRFTLTSGRRIELKPRGRRGDLDIVNTTEQDDPIFLANHGLLFELIEPDHAKHIIRNQATNESQTEHPIWSHLLNENGQPYTQRVAHVEEVFEKQGIVVGTIEETGAGRFTDRNFKVSRSAAPQITTVPGSPGHPATEYMTSVPGDVAPGEYHEFLLWKQFKAEMAAAEEAKALRESLTVSVEPVETQEG